MKPQHLALLTLLASIWGGSFLFIRIVVPHFGPVPLTASRSLIAACTLMPLLLWQGRWQEFRRHWPHLLVLGLISTALPFTFLSISTQYTSAGFASILNALTPVFSAIIARLWLDERLSLPANLGIGLSFIGLLVMVFDRDTIKSSFPLLPILAGMSATFLYGLTGNYSRKFVQGVSTLTVTAGCQAFSALALLPFALWQWPSEPVPASAWLWVAVLGVVCTGTAYMIYFHLLAVVGVARTVIVTYLSPVFAVLWGFMFLGEGVTLKMLIGAFGIMAGIALTTYRPKGSA